MSREEVRAFAKRINEATPETMALVKKISELQARLELYAILDEPGVACSRGKYWDGDKKEYYDGWLCFDRKRFDLLGFLGAGQTLEAALRNVQQKRLANQGKVG